MTVNPITALPFVVRRYYGHNDGELCSAHRYATDAGVESEKLNVQAINELVHYQAETWDGRRLVRRSDGHGYNVLDKRTANEKEDAHGH